jgi:hypothetical protein
MGIEAKTSDRTDPKESNCYLKSPYSLSQVEKRLDKLDNKESPLANPAIASSRTGYTPASAEVRRGESGSGTGGRGGDFAIAPARIPPSVETPLGDLLLMVAETQNRLGEGRMARPYDM